MAFLVLKRDSDGNVISKIPIFYFYLIAFVAACVAFVLSLKISNITGGVARSIFNIIVLWAVSACIATGIVYLNYTSARKLLIPTSKSYREYKLSRLVMTLTLYTVIIHILMLGISSKLVSIDSESIVFENATLIKPVYLMLCGWILLSSWIFGAIPLSLKTEWNEEFFIIFTTVSFAGAIFGASAFIIFVLIRSLKR